MSRTRWALLGPGAISRDFTAGLAASEHGVLHAVGSSSPERARDFADRFGADVAGSYDDVLARDDVDAVYIGTVHTTHADLAIRALQAGKGVLCEKPASPTVADLDRILGAARAADRPFLEAYKNRFGPFARSLDAIVAGGELGEPVHLDASFGFAAPTRDGRLFDPALAGGAILDVGCYPVSLAVALARGADAELTAATGERERDVDASAQATLGFGSFTADVSTSIVQPLSKSISLRFTDGLVETADAWGSRAQSATTLRVKGSATDERVLELPTVNPMGAEADALSRALEDGALEVPEVPWAMSRTIARVLEEWRGRVLA